MSTRRTVIYARPRQPWHVHWWAALRRPHPKTYLAISQDADGYFERAAWWVFVAGMLGHLALWLSYLPRFDDLRLALLCLLLVLNPLGGVLMVGVFYIKTRVSQLVARALQGSAVYGRYALASAAYYAPLLLSLMLLWRLPINAPLLAVLGGYAFLCDVSAIKGAHGVGWPQAFISSGVVFWVTGFFLLISIGFWAWVLGALG